MNYPYTMNYLENYPLAPDKMEMKREMLSEYQVKIADLYKLVMSKN